MTEEYSKNLLKELDKYYHLINQDICLIYDKTHNNYIFKGAIDSIPYEILKSDVISITIFNEYQVLKEDKAEKGSERLYKIIINLH